MTSYSKRWRAITKMKLQGLIFTCFLLVQCTSLERSNAESTNTKLDTQVIQEIQEYYLTGEGKGLKHELNESDSENELIFWEEDGFTLMRILIPKVINVESSEVFFPDFDSDGLKDIVVEVYREGGWGGGNVSDKEILIFRNHKTGYVFKSVNNSRNLTDCNSGQFSLEGLEEGKLIGTSYCYAPDDGHCCPSLEYKTTLLEKDWKLEHLKSEMK